MATIINNPSGSGDGDSSGSALGMIVGIIVILLIVVLFFVYFLPMIRGNAPATAPEGTTNINVQVPNPVNPGTNGGTPSQSGGNPY